MQPDNYEHFKTLSEKRYSVRDYADTPVSKQQIEKLLDTVRLAPSAVNRQPWTFIVATEQKIKEQLHGCYSREWFQSAPVYIVICGDHSTSWKRPSDGKDHCDIDIAICTEHLCLAATEMGLGTCWVCNFDARKCADILSLPDHIEPIVIVPIGYAKECFHTPEKNRKPLTELIRWEKY